MKKELKNKAAAAAAKVGVGLLQKLLDRAAEKPFWPRVRLVQRFRARFGRQDLSKVAERVKEEIK